MTRRYTASRKEEEGASMHRNRLERLARTLAQTAPRRTTLGLGAAGLLGALGLEDVNAKNKRKKGKKKKCKKKCGPCQKCKKGKCKAVAAGTPCGEGQQCFADGRCVACDVCHSGCDHTTLQAAIGAAAVGATIQLCPGTYATNAIVEKDLTVVGAGSGAGGTVLDGQGISTVLDLDDVNDVKVRGLKVTGGAKDYGAGIHIVRGVITLEDVEVTGNHATKEAGGIYAFRCGRLTLINCRIAGNSSPKGGGILNHEGPLILTHGTIVTQNTGNTTGGNDGHTAGGIHNEDGGTVTIIDGSSVTGNIPFNCAGTPAC
jgi:hypothetical protein